MAYSLAASGSDWLEWHVRDVATSKDLPDVIKWSKFSGAAWLKDGSGFFYSRYDEPKAGSALTAVNKFQKVYFHKLGTPQDADTLVYERQDQPDWGLSADVTDDGRFLLIYQSEGTKPENRVFVKDLTRARRARSRRSSTSSTPSTASSATTATRSTCRPTRTRRGGASWRSS